MNAIWLTHIPIGIININFSLQSIGANACQMVPENIMLIPYQFEKTHGSINTIHLKFNYLV